MSAPRTRAEAEKIFMDRAKAVNGSGASGSRRTLDQFAADEEAAGRLPAGTDAEIGDGPMTQRGANVVAMPQRKLPRPEPLPESIDIEQESVRTILNIRMKDTTIRTFTVYDVPFFRADEFVFLEKQIAKLREGFDACTTMAEIKALRDQVADLVAEEAQIVIPEMKVEVLRELGPRQYKAVSDLIARIGGEVVGMYDLSPEPKKEEADPNAQGVAASGTPDTMYPNAD